MSSQPAPAKFAGLVELSSDVLGTFVLYATDDYFAAKENLIAPSAPVWIEGKYTDKGKWMDGWESQRRREPGHDFAILRLGAPGRVRGALVDTTHFKGNAPQQISLEAIEASHTATAAQLLDSKWSELIPRSDVKPDSQNLFDVEIDSRATHVRLRIFPDGGVARLRIYGEVEPDLRTFWRAGSVDLAALENGGTIAMQSDAFFGPPQNMLLPGRGVNMGDGWETKRRRTPGSDWAVIQLARRGIIERIELDTHFFKGNAPQAVLIEGIDAEALEPGELENQNRWMPVLDRAPLVQHCRHQFEPVRVLQPLTHVRVHIFPHGGVNRLRLFGRAASTPTEYAALERLANMDARRQRELLLSFCGSQSWAARMAAIGQAPTVQELLSAADAVWWSLEKKDWLEAFAAHPRIGSKKKAKPQTSKSAGWSKGEQRGVTGSDAAVLKQLVKLNDDYFKKFGFIFIVFATGKSAGEMLELLEQRIKRSKAKEIETAAIEQAKITRLRIEKWLVEQLTK